ncbi:MAG TPA: hypothetical protein VM095_06945 [Pyrinomonadaceae bacterium]|nr:hypothetical protein [Pyrinomonadaceae bacterium]
MRTKREAQVTTRETQKVWLIRQRWNPLRERCEQCNRQAQMLTPEEAASFSGTDLESINSRMKLGEFHGKEMSEGLFLICINSLL